MKRLVLLVTSLTLLSMLNPPWASATIDTGATALQIAQGIAEDPSQVTSASFDSVTGGIPNALSSTSLDGFPTDGADFGLLTTGDATLANNPNNDPDLGVDNFGGPVRGDTDQDVTILKIDLNVPVEANCITVEFRFLTEEFPEYVGTAYNDAFIAELDSSTWTTSGSDITAPDNFAFDPDGNVISVNAAGATSVTAGEAHGTTYDGATPILAASTPITSGAHSLYLSIFDQGDGIYDSAAFVDNLTLSTADKGGCVAGAFPHQPDAQIKQGGPYKGNNTYNNSGKKQTITVSVHHGSDKTFNIKVQNDGLASDSFTVQGCGSSTGFTVSYKKGSDTITGAVKAGNYLIGPLNPGLSKTIKVTIEVKASGDGKTKTCKVTAESVGDTTRSDTVVAEVEGT